MVLGIVVYFKHANLVLKENVQALMDGRKIKQTELAMWCGHRKSWLNKWLRGNREIQFKDLDRMADFFGMLPHQLFTPGISSLTERRLGVERRQLKDRRVPLATKLGLATHAPAALPKPTKATTLDEDLYNTVARHGRPVTARDARGPSRKKTGRRPRTRTPHR